MIHTAQNMNTYRHRISEALADDFLRSALDRFNTAYREARPQVYKDIDFEALRQKVAADKDSSINRLMQLFHTFKAQAEAAGAVVHTARNAVEANALICRIAAENRVKRIIKSKSMTAEETFLNHDLEQSGFMVKETDLGEWIIQLRREGPSHMVMPAIHLSRYQVGDLFSQVTGARQNAEDIDALVKVARAELRDDFLQADMGISGANFAIADSGVLGMVSNEGNLRLTTTLPRIHLALVGYEKLIPDFRTALNILKVLPRNATGQAITSYVTWTKGAVPCAKSPSGKKILHIVFLDNGRLALAQDPVFGEALRCIRCGACANVCPIYSKIGGHKYGHVYIGAIGLILTLFYHGHENDRAIVRNCLNCQACRDVCPAGIDLPYLIKKTQRIVIDRDRKPPIKNLMLSGLMSNRRLFHTVLRNAWRIQKPFIAKNSEAPPMIRHLPYFLEQRHGFRSLPMIAQTPLRDLWRTIRPRITQAKLRVALFAGCAIDFIYPEQGQTFAALMEHFYVQVDFPMEQTCCGLPLAMAAEETGARRLAAQNINAFTGKAIPELDYIVTLCASCASHLKHSYPKLIGNENVQEMENATRHLASFTNKIIDFSSFVRMLIQGEKISFSSNELKTAYHSPCHLGRGLGVTDAPRELIQLGGYEYVKSKDEDVCCGFGGSYSVDFPEIAAAVLEKKLDNLIASGADQVVMDCPGCVLQIRGGMDKRQNQMRVLHIAQALAENIRRG